MALVMSMGTAAFAANDGSIEVKSTHKGQVYELYQLFDATTVEGRTDGGEGISYKLMSGKTDFKATVGGVEVDGAQWFKLVEGNVVIKDDTAKAAITDDNADFAAWAKAYGAKNATTIEASADGAEVKWTGLAEGYYFISTTTGSLVTIDSIKPNAEVQDKNPGTEITKTITDANSMDAAGKNALAQVGTDVSYESRIPISRGAYNYKFTDVMSDGLTLKTGSVKVYVVATSGAAVADGAADVNDACGTIIAQNKTGTDADITITFDDDWLKANWEKEIVIQYTATVNANAIIADAANPNTAKIEYGNEDKPLTDEDEAKVYSAKVTVKKIDGDGNALEGAGFKLKNADNKWYKNTDGIVSWVDTEEAGTEIFPVKTAAQANPAYDAAAAAAAAEAGEPYDVPETIGGSDDAVASFTGIADGTYTLVETTVPTGYNKAADTPITIKPASTNNLTTELTVEAEVTNNSGTELPSTGGIGTTIFYVVGSILVVAAGVLLITKKRMSREG